MASSTLNNFQDRSRSVRHDRDEQRFHKTVSTRLSQLNPESQRRYSHSSTRRSSVTSICSTKVGTARDLVDLGPTDTDHTYYEVGQVVWTLHTEPNLDRNACAEEETIAVSRIGGPIRQKLRPCIIIGIYFDKLRVIPIFSSHGNGMLHKREEIRKNLFYAANQEVYDSEVWAHHRKQKDAPPVLKIAAGSAFTLSEGSYIDLTRDFSVDYDCPIRNADKYTMCTRLTDESVEELKKAWLKANLNGIDAVVKKLPGANAGKPVDRRRSYNPSASMSRRNSYMLVPMSEHAPPQRQRPRVDSVGSRRSLKSYASRRDSRVDETDRRNAGRFSDAKLQSTPPRMAGSMPQSR